jgi:hypothetical protein
MILQDGRTPLDLAGCNDHEETAVVSTHGGQHSPNSRHSRCKSLRRESETGMSDEVAAGMTSMLATRSVVKGQFSQSNLVYS